MIATILAFLTPVGRFLKPYAGYLLIAALLALALWGVHHRGYKAGIKHEQAAQAERVEKAKKRVQEGEKKADAITTKAEAEHVRTVEKIRTVTQTLYKEVSVAVPQDPARLNIAWGAVRLLDSAILGVPSLPNPSGVSDATPSTVTDADLTRTGIANAEACRINSETVKAWQSFWTDQAANYNATIGAKR